MNKLYFVRDIEENMGVVISAPTSKIAKSIGYAEICDTNFTNIGCNAISTGSWHITDRDGPMFNITGQGIVTTDLPTGYVMWQDFINEIKKQGRYEEDGNDTN